jgi:hypothetical protein
MIMQGVHDRERLPTLAVMPERLPRKLGPKARKWLMTADAGDVVRAMAEVGPAADPAELRDGVTALGGVVRSWSPESRLLVVEIPAAGLAELAGLAGVVSVETAERYRR